MKKNPAKNKKILKEFGLNIKFYRHKMNLTQEQIAEKIDAERSYITALENGTKSPSIYFAYEIAEALNVSLNQILDIRV